MNITRKVVRGILFVAFVLAAAVVAYALSDADAMSQVAWSTVAASLAVIAATLSAWSSQRVLELQEDATLPAPYPSLDFTSRYSLIQLRVTNNGGSTAFNISLDWRKPILNSEGEVVAFPHEDGRPEIPVLASGDSISIPIGEGHRFMSQKVDMNYSGSISYETASAVRLTRKFYLSAEPYRKSLDYDKESARTHYELQKLPKELEKLRKEVALIAEKAGGDGTSAND